MKDLESVGMIGALGDMGKLYVRLVLKHHPHITLHLCDSPSNYESLLGYYQRTYPQITSIYTDTDATTPIVLHKDGFGVSRVSEYIIYSIPTSVIEDCIALYGPATRVGAIVGGQTSVKYPEIQAFRKHLPHDCYVVTVHSMHGPSVDPYGNPLAIIPFDHTGHGRRVDELQEATKQVKILLAPFESHLVELEWTQHDSITADTQAVTHLAFLSMGLAWSTIGVYPWLSSDKQNSTDTISSDIQHPRGDYYMGGIEEIKKLLTMRIYGSKWHVYAGLAIMNENAKVQVQQYSRSVRELFELMITQQNEEFYARLNRARQFVFGHQLKQQARGEAIDWLIDPALLTAAPAKKYNSHLSILAIIDSWTQLNLNPFQHLKNLPTPPFHLWLATSQHLCLSQVSSKEFLFDLSLRTALEDTTMRQHDLGFLRAVDKWVDCVMRADWKTYQTIFEGVAAWLGEQVPEAKKRSDEFIRQVKRRTCE